MLSGISLVAITSLLVLDACANRAMDHSSAATQQEQKWVLISGREVLRHALHDNVTTSDVSAVTADAVTVAGDEDGDKLTTFNVQDFAGAQPKIGEVEERDLPRGRKRRQDRTMVALLMAYKLKMIALIPTLLGGLILLKGTTLLAGFFFSLFAAVLGLKIH